MPQPSDPERAELPADAVELARVDDAWGVRGWFKVQPHGAGADALLAARQWFLLPPEKGPKPFFDGVRALALRQARVHGSGVVASAHGVEDRDAAQALRGARVFVARSQFPALTEGEYYWVDLIGLSVFNRQGELLGVVSDLLAAGPQSTLVLGYEQGGKRRERMIPFVAAYIDAVDLSAGRIGVDWQSDY